MQKTCEACGTVFAKTSLISRSNWAKARFCSRGCADAAQRQHPLKRFWRYVAIQGRDGCWLWTGTKRQDGYGVLGVKGGTPIRAHRLSYETYVGPIPEGMFVLHSCNNPSCVNPFHLRVGYCKENYADQRLAGTNAKGETHGNHKLTEPEVIDIARADGSNSAIARQFGINPSTVSRIKTGKRWAHLSLAGGV